MTAPAPGFRAGHMIVCGNDPLTHRLTLELVHLYRERVTLIVPNSESGHGPQLLALAEDNPGSVAVIEGRTPDEGALVAAGIKDAAALALTMDDDQDTIHAALLARSLNPRIRLVLQVFDGTLGRRVESLLNRAAERRMRERGEEPPPAGGSDASTTVLSASATAAPALVAAAVSGPSQLIPVDGGMLAVSQQRPGDPRPVDALPIALLPPRPSFSSGPPGLEAGSAVLLPHREQAEEALADRQARAAVLLQHSVSQNGARRKGLERVLGLPLGALFSRRLRLAGITFAVVVAVLTLLNLLFSGLSPGASLYRVLMDLADMTNPEPGVPMARKVLQLVAAYFGMAITPVILALVLDSLGALGTSYRRPPRTMSGHVILIGLGKIGTRVLDRLTEMGVQVVCIERNPDARGLRRARKLRVPVVVGDVSYPEVYDRARIARSSTVMALTSDDRVNLEAVLYARDHHPTVGVVLRLFDDSFASTVYRALRASEPTGRSSVTVSRSVSYLAAPAFSAAMLGRQVLAAIPVERHVLLVAAVDVAGHPELVGRTVRQAFRPGGWRVIGVDQSPRATRRPMTSGVNTDTLGRGITAGGGAASATAWDPSPDLRLREDDRVVVVATREGLGALLQRREVREETPVPTLAVPPQGFGPPLVAPGTAVEAPTTPSPDPRIAAERPTTPLGGLSAAPPPGDPREYPASAGAGARRAPGSRFRKTAGARPPRPDAAEPPEREPADAVPIPDAPTVPLPQAPRALPSAPYRPGTTRRVTNRQGRPPEPEDERPERADAEE